VPPLPIPHVPPAVGSAVAATSGLDIEQLVRLVADAVSSKITATGRGDDVISPSRDLPTVTSAATTPTVAENIEREVAAHSIAPRHSSVKLCTFDGSGNWNAFIVRFEACAGINEWSDQEKLVRLM